MKFKAYPYNYLYNLLYTVKKITQWLYKFDVSYCSLKTSMPVKYTYHIQSTNKKSQHCEHDIVVRKCRNYANDPLYP